MKPHTAEQEQAFVVGIDYGATNLRAATVSSDGRIHHRLHMPVPLELADRLSLPLVAAATLSRQWPTAAIGLAIAGTVHDGVVAWSANLGLGEVSYEAMLVAHTGLPVSVVNDARAAGYAETVLGAARGGRVVLYVSVGTGIGGAILIDGRLVDGTGDAGEIGHMIVDPAGPLCGCGQHGCWEAMCGGAALDQLAREHARVWPEGLVAGSAGGTPSAKDLVVAARDGDNIAAAALDRAALMFATGLDNIGAVLAPDVVVLGGGIMSHPGLVRSLYAERLTDLRWIRGDIRFAEFGNDAGTIGAALLCSAVARR